MTTTKSQDALLAGVCQHIAQTFRWNVWAIRVVFVALLLTKTVLAIIIYAVAALLLEAYSRYRREESSEEDSPPLKSEELGSRSQRIEELDQRFRKWEESIGE